MDPRIRELALPDPAVATPEDVVIARRAAVELLLALTMKQRVAVLCLAVGLSTAEAAEVAGEVCPRAMRYRLERARARIAERAQITA